jgi:tetratricopeptide (TPR) repeat protein
MAASSATARTASIELVVDPWEECQVELEAERDRHPRFPDVRTLLGMLYLESGRAAEAVAELESAVEVNPDYLLARFHRLVALRMRDGRLAARRWREAGLEERAGDPERSLWTSWYRAQSGDAAGALAALEPLAENPRWKALAHYNAAIRTQMRSDPGAAREALDRAARAHPIYGAILEDRGLVRGRRGSREGPAQGPASLVPPGSHPDTWNPGTAPIYEHLGMHCARSGALIQASRFFDEAFLRQGDESAHQVRRASLALAQGNEEEAVQALRRAIEVDPTSADARIALGFEYQSQGYHDEALVQFEVAARLRPTYADVQYNLGLLYQAHGREEDARRCFARALQINPRYFQARTSLTQSLLRGGEHRRALEALEPLVRQGVRSADLLVQKAEAHLALGEVPLALRELERAVEVNPGYARTFYVLGQVHRRQGLKRKAQEAWRQYLERTRQSKEEQRYLDAEEWKP